MPPVLELSHVRKTFFDPGRGPVHAVDDISVQVEPGVVALVGANGAGKSTLLRCIATLLAADSGSIRFGAVDALSDPAGLRQRLGYLSTTTRLYPKLTAREHLSYAAGFHDLDGATLAERIAVVSATFGLDDFIDQRCEGLSTGQGQRVNLARTLLTDPDLLILDEPTTGLDIRSAQHVVDAVLGARRDGRVIIIATHIMSEVEDLADRLLVIDQGRFVFDGPPDELGRGADLAHAVHRLIAGSDRPEASS